MHWNCLHIHNCKTILNRQCHFPRAFQWYHGYSAATVGTRVSFKPCSSYAAPILIIAIRGTAFGFSVFLNGKFLGSGVNSAASLDTQAGTYNLNSSLLNASDNVVAVILDNTGDSYQS